MPEIYYGLSQVIFNTNECVGSEHIVNSIGALYSENCEAYLEYEPNCG